MESTSWELLGINSNSVYDFVSVTESLEDGVYDGTLCLPEGEYQFTIYDLSEVGICYGQGSYNLTSYGNVIMQGGQFRAAGETTMFDLPFDPSTSTVVTTSTTFAPATYAPTSPSPSLLRRMKPPAAPAPVPVAPPAEAPE